MNNTATPKKTILTTVVLTAFLTLVVSGTAAFFLGYLHVSGQTGIMSISEHDPAEHGAQKETLYTCGMHPWIIKKEPGNCPICGMKLTPKLDNDSSASGEAAGERKIIYWRAPMNPQEIYDKPGKSAMGMDLVPVYEDEVKGGVNIKIDPVVVQNMGIRTATVEKGAIEYTIRTYGHITYDETRTVEISPRFSGWIEKLDVDFTGQQVGKGQSMFDIYSPELVTAQEEYLVALRNYKQQPNPMRRKMVQSVRQRLLYFDIPESELKAIEHADISHKTLNIKSPSTGIVIFKNALEGGYVKAGTPVYRIADLSRVWVEAHIYEYELDKVHTGLAAEMTLPYLPGKVYKGKVTFVYPYLQQKTRDVVIRIEFDNPGFELKPDMYADILVKTVNKEPGLIIPSEAVIRSGERNIVFVARDIGKFSPRQVKLGGAVDDGRIQILSGLAPGETVVTSGQFLLDSESKLKEAVQKMLDVKQPAAEVKKDTSDDDFFNDI